MAGNLFIKRPKFAIVISIAIILAGLISLTTLPLEEYPSITPPQVIVNATYAGASSDVITSTIAAPVELQLNGIEDMLYMQSESRNGSYSLTLYFDVGADPDMALVNVQNQLQLVQPRLPEEVKRFGLTVKKATGGSGCLYLALTSPNKTYNSLFLANYATLYIKDELARTKGCGQVQVFGAGDYSMRIWLKPDKMASLGVSASEINAAITSQNIQAPAGNIGVEPFENPQMMKFTLRTKGRLKTVEEFENIIVKSNVGGSNVKIKDVARVELGAENYSSAVSIGKADAAIIAISQLPDANTIDLVNRIEKKMEVLSKKFPNDIKYDVQYDTTEFVRESIKEVISAILLAIALVSAVTYLFLGTARAAFIPFCAIPVSLIGVFIFMALMGFSINLLILFGLVLAVGLVVDDAIVVLENTQRHIQEGKSPKDATEITMEEVFGAVVATSLVLMAVFVPVSFMSGITGQMYRQFAVCIATSIGLSTLVALTLSPALCAMILKSGEEKADFEFIQKFENWFNGVRDKYLGVVEYFVRSPKKTLATLIGIVGLILAMFIITPTGFLPDEDRGALFVMVQLQDGATLTRTANTVQRIADQLVEIPGVYSVMQINGFKGENTAFLILKLEEWSKRKSSKLSIGSITKQAQAITARYPEATSFVTQPPAISGMGMYGGFEYQLLDKGDRSSDELFAQAQSLIRAANGDPAFSSIYTSFTSSLPQVVVNIEEDKAMAQGVSISEIYTTLAAQFGSTYVNDFNKYGRIYRVYMQADAPYRETLSDMSKIYVKNNQGRMVPLSAVISTKDIVGPYSLTRFNMYPAITVNGNPASGVSSGSAMAEMAKISDETLPKDMDYAWSGTSLQEQQSSGQIGPILAMALIFVYLFLVALYESWTLPIAVLLISPVALLGALFFQYVWGLSLDVYAQVGLVMLIGLSTKQAILIVEFAKDAMDKEGMHYVQAAMQAALLRFRAVMMTNIAFILGLLPLVFAKGAGAGSRNSIGVSVFGGMMAVAFLGSILVPAFFVMINVMKEKSSEYIQRFKK
ncbi:MAG: efflux RND transporter permease subunit [Candidatus Gastranaerophilales bacterium]|nr:efflux RND transporter permease subunit [Candidatus Gastranaerophilales bacterium]